MSDMSIAELAPVKVVGRIVEGLRNNHREAVLPPSAQYYPGTQRKRSQQAHGQWIKAESILSMELSDVPQLQYWVKRTMDLTLATLALLLPLPFLLLIAIAIRLDSPGPVIFKQKRVGSNWGRRDGNLWGGTGSGPLEGRTFRMWKFRTMYQDAEQRLAEVLGSNMYGEDLFVKVKDDPRITRVGRILRRFSLDEWPQFVNVLRGDMSVVGNRPLPVYEAEQLAEVWQKIRFLSPSGITGLWQVSGRSDLSAQERIELDDYYALKNAIDWSPGDDLFIIVKTPWVMLTGKGAH